ncbi:MAG: efflux RND transporter periplasmic adaptor subunit [Nitrospiraceae bacterium]|nr:efflux RND transporter periplasmic adaptor subunit [Nitrospiraceae bacterium]
MKKIALIAALTLTLPMLFTGCKEKVKPGVHVVSREQVSGLGVRTVALAPFDDYYETTGTVKAKTVSMVASRLMGTITSVRVAEGDRVAAGQLLLTIDDSDVAQKVKGAAEGHNEALKALEEAKENRNLREITWRRYKKLYDGKALSRQELDQIETQKKVADLDYERAQAAVRRVEAGLNEAKVYQGFARLKSPVSGVVTEKKAEPGSMAVPGMPLLTVEDTSAYRLEINADEKLAGKIRRGMEVKIRIDSLNREMRGIVTDVVQSVDPVTRSFLVKIALKDSSLRSGLYARVSIPVGQKNLLVVPRSAVVEKGELTGVYTVDGSNVISYRLIRTGRTYGDGVEVLSGLSPDEKIVVTGVEKAIDGGSAVLRQ